ncbi:MAG TPA: DMT family transporter [Gaiellaceae bacterium]|nr:DMT family transporter [Gaiellaceae bacterium]
MRDRSAYLLLLGMAVCFGGTWPAGKLAVEEVEPFTVAAARFTIATVLLAFWVGLRHGPIRAPGRADLPLVIAMGATAVAGYNIFFLYGLELAPATDGAIIVPGFAPVFTVLLGWAVLGERVSRSVVAGLALAFAGLVAVVGPGGSIDADRLAGAALFVAGAFCWGIYLLIGRPAIARFGAVRSTLYATATGTAMLIPFSLAERGWRDLENAEADGWLPILYLAVFGTVVAFVLFYEGVSRIGPARAASFAMLVPIFGVLSSVALLGERLRISLVVGGAAIIAGLWLIQRR